MRHSTRKLESGPYILRAIVDILLTYQEQYLLRKSRSILPLKSANSQFIGSGIFVPWILSHAPAAPYPKEYVSQCVFRVGGKSRW